MMFFISLLLFFMSLQEIRVLFVGFFTPSRNMYVAYRRIDRRVRNPVTSPGEGRGLVTFGDKRGGPKWLKKW